MERLSAIGGSGCNPGGKPAPRRPVKSPSAEVPRPGPIKSRVPQLESRARFDRDGFHLRSDGLRLTSGGLRLNREGTDLKGWTPRRYSWAASA